MPISYDISISIYAVLCILHFFFDFGIFLFHGLVRRISVPIEKRI
jgi:hypothetical protein